MVDGSVAQGATVTLSAEANMRPRFDSAIRLILCYESL